MDKTQPPRYDGQNGEPVGTYLDYSYSYSTSYTAYTPTTEEVRNAAHNKAFFPLFRDRADFDRWLAAHDAEVRQEQIRVEADRDRLTEAVQAAYNALHMETRSRAVEILHDALSGVVAEEPEWDYGVRGTGDEEPFTDHYESLDAMSEEFDGRVVWNAGEEIVRRRKAGPWGPVEN